LDVPGIVTDHPVSDQAPVRGLSRKMSGQTHSPMQNARDGNRRFSHPVHDHVRTDRINSVGGGQLVVLMACFGIQTDRFECLIKKVAVDQQLGVPPGLPGITQYSNEIASSPSG
jgi:hypothetical protein